MKQVSVILPSFNERQNIVEAITRIETTLGDRLLEVIVVDDDSPDLTWQVVSELRHSWVRLIRRKNEKGLASAIAAGVDQSRGDIVAWLDCDLGVPPEILGNLVDQLDRYDVAIASRFVDGGRDLRANWVVVCSYLINLLAQLLLNSKIKDYTSGVIAVDRKVLDNVQINSRGVFGEYFIEFSHRCVQKNYSIIEVGYSYNNRAAGYSKSTGDIFTFFRLGLHYGVKVLVIWWSNR